MKWEYLSVMVSWRTSDPGIMNGDCVVVNYKRSDLVAGQRIDYDDPSHEFAVIKLLEIGEESVTVEYQGRTKVVEPGGWRGMDQAARDYSYFYLEIDLRLRPLIR